MPYRTFNKLRFFGFGVYTCWTVEPALYSHLCLPLSKDLIRHCLHLSSRQVERRLWWLANLERGLLGPRGVGRRFTTHLMIGPDPEDPDQPLYFPHAAAAITRALQKITPWHAVHQELSYVLAALSSYRQLFPSDLSGEPGYTV